MKKMMLAWLVTLFLAGNSLIAQDEMDTIVEIDRLRGDLQSTRIPERDAAEKRLIEIGELVLDHLELDDSGTVDFRERVLRVRTALEKIAISKNTKASKLKFDSNKMTVENLLQQVKLQTGNDVVFGRQVTLEAYNQEVTIEGEDLEFWDVLNQLTEQTNLKLDPFAGDVGQLALSEQFENEEQAEPIRLLDSSSVMRFQITRVDATRNFQNPALSFYGVEMVIRWEPRITPIAIDFPLNSIEIIDEFDQVLETNQEGVFTGIVSPDIPELEFTINTPMFDRQVESIKSISGVVDAVLPGRVETFKFKDITNLAVDSFQEKAGAKVTFGGIEKNEDLWGVRVSLGFDEENNALESHQAWVYNNEVYLIGEDGEKQEPIGSETFQQTNESVGILYYFGDDPKGMDLHYKTPAAVVKVKIPFIIKGIPLP